VVTHFDIIHTGFFRLDGGAMFGVVPRRLWANLNPPDERNMCTWAMRCMLVHTSDGRKILIDTGIGNKQDDKFRSHFEPHGTENLFDSLEKAGCRREDITDVFLTHLHFDHAGGALWKNETTGQVEPAFPNAVYWSNERHFNWAIHPNDREKASFLSENFLPLQQSGQMQWVPVRQNVLFAPGFRVRFAYGHTEAMMLPLLDTPVGKILYCADLLPSKWHVPMPYVMAYDVRPLLTLREKKKLLEEAAERNYLLFLEHDPVDSMIRLKKENGKITIREN
jgi:glyoxylase-like metal-dependent hydrolase (beta-lactamase superfamily II)